MSWSEELTRYLFIWSAFISISYCIKKWISIKIDQLINVFSKSLYVVFQLLLNVVLCLFFLYMSYHAFCFLQDSIASAQRSPALGLPMYIVQAAPACRLCACYNSQLSADSMGKYKYKKTACT